MTTFAPASPIASASPADVPAVARTLTAAFDDDPFVRWLVGRDERLVRNYVVWLERAWLPHGEVHTTENGRAVACWIRPGEAHLGLGEQLRMLPAMVRAAGFGLPRQLRGLGAAEKLHPREPHWYLPQIGVAPDAQGRGVGSRLLGHMLERVDAERMPAYLEATTPRSRGLYERHGFELMSEERLPKGGPPYWRMWRDPR